MWTCLQDLNPQSPPPDPALNLNEQTDSNIADLPTSSQQIVDSEIASTSWSEDQDQLTHLAAGSDPEFEAELLVTTEPLGIPDFNIYHEGNISKMPDFDVFSLLEIRKRKSRSHGIRKKGNGKRKKHAVKRSNTSLKDLSKILADHGRHSKLSFLSSLPISVLRILDTEANKFYDRNHQLYDAALLTRCYTQHALHAFIDSETNHKRHFIKIPFINKGIEFIDLPSIFKDRSVTSSIPTYFQNSEPPIICYKYNKPIRNIVFNFKKLVPDFDIHASIPES